MRTLVLFAFLLAGPTTGTPPSPNYMLLADGDHAVPFASVVATSFTPLHFQADGTTYPGHSPLAGHTLYGYRAGRLVGTFTVDAVLPAQDDDAGGGDRALLGAHGGAGKGAALYTTKPLAQRARPATAPPSPSMGAEAQRLVAALLDRPGLPRRLRTLALPADAVHAVAVARTGEPLLVVALDDAFSDGLDGLGLLLVAERRRGHYVQVLQRVRWGGGECRAGWALADHADLDGDGVDELVVKTWGWESVSVAVLTRVKGKWSAAPAFPLPPQDGC